MGIIDKKELRERVLSYRPPVQPAPVQPAPVSRIVPSTPAQSPTVCGKRKREQIEKKVQPAQQRFNKKQIKKRPGKPAATRAKIRKLVRDPTRQRFFEQCRSRASVLWQPTAAGTEQMVKLLFDRACLDPIDTVYRCMEWNTGLSKRKCIDRSTKTAPTGWAKLPHAIWRSALRCRLTGKRNFKKFETCNRQKRNSKKSKQSRQPNQSRQPRQSKQRSRSPNRSKCRSTWDSPKNKPRPMTWT